MKVTREDTAQESLSILDLIIKYKELAGIPPEFRIAAEIHFLADAVVVIATSIADVNLDRLALEMMTPPVTLLTFVTWGLQTLLVDTGCTLLMLLQDAWRFVVGAVIADDVLVLQSINDAHNYPDRLEDAGQKVPEAQNPPNAVDGNF